MNEKIKNTKAFWELNDASFSGNSDNFDDNPPGGSSQQNALIGTWITNIAGNEIEVTYRSDRTYSERAGGVSANGVYSVAGNRITTIAAGIGTSISEFEIKGNVLTAKSIYVEVHGRNITSTSQGMIFT